MKNIISEKKFRDFMENHAESRKPMLDFLQALRDANWQTINELKEDYPNASILQNNRVCFNIKGGHYRIILRINYDSQTAFVRFIGTHAEYDKIDDADAI